jgi:16S rRNA (guanine527-N7)-methyltransferase
VTVELRPDRPGPDDGEDSGAAARWRGETASLVGVVRSWGEDVRPDAEEDLARLAGAIDRWNTVINLVSRKDIGRLATYHFCDAASVLPLLNVRRRVETLDVGGSNGLPGLVLAALSPHIAVTVCDSRQKRKAFLKEVCGGAREGAAGLGTFEIAQVDGGIFQKRHAEGFDLILARAVTRLSPLLKWCMPLLRPGGRLVAYKGSRSAEEVDEARAYFLDHGGGMLAVVGSPMADTCNPLRMFVIATRHL